MAAAIGVQTDYTSEDLRRFARRCGAPDQVRRLLAVPFILDGGSRSEAARGCRRHTADRARLGAAVQRR